METVCQHRKNIEVSKNFMAVLRTLVIAFTIQVRITSICCCTVQIFAIRPRSIYQYSNMAPRLSGQTSIFGVVFFVSKSPLGIERQKKLEKFTILTRKPRSHARILIYRTWPIKGYAQHYKICRCDPPRENR